MKKMLILLGVAALVAIAASGCGKDASRAATVNEGPNAGNAEMSHSGMGDMEHSDSGALPPNLKPAANPAYSLGSKVVIHADHMEGMNGATATVTGAYDTVVYAVTYTPTTGGDKVSNHKWVVQEEIKDARQDPYKPGDSVMLQADHMKGMDGAKAVIDSAERTTVYTVDYTPTNGGEKVTNHKWLDESELSAASQSH